MNFFKRLIVVILTWESRIILKKYKPFIVAVTGSVGKTSTKDSIYDVLRQKYNFVRKSEKSMNSDIGLPLTVIGVPNAWHDIGGWINNINHGLRLILTRVSYPECLILEIGADHPGDISKIAHWLRPNIAVITRVSMVPVHVEFFSSPEQVFEEKASLVRAVPAGGSAILFGDEDKILTLTDELKSKAVKVTTFGMKETVGVRCESANVRYSADGVNDIPNPNPANSPSSFSETPTGMTFGFKSGTLTMNIETPGVIGKTYAYPLLAALAVGLDLGMSSDAIKKGMNSYEAPKGRMRLIPGKNSSTIIDDSYNSSPDAVIAALNTLKDLRVSGKRLVILGDMMELGKYSAAEHKKVGKEVVGIADILVTVGPRSKAIADEALAGDMSSQAVSSFDTSTLAGEYAASKIAAGDVVLVKGSQSIRMERTVEMLMADPSRAGEVLVRQEREWLEKK
jgi:UDP-N-acetylmuramyl pentapeptide synthase